MKKQLTVSIGIPAFNEEANIVQLVKSLLRQRQKRISIDEILVYTDGSTDKTPLLLKSIKEPKLKLKIGKLRIGQQLRQNQLVKDYKGDVLVIIEADILPYNESTVEYLVEPFLKERNGRLGMVVGSPIIVEPSGFFEKILFYGYSMKYNLFADWKNGENIFTCGGHSMKALSKKFTKKLIWPKDVPEDAYTYLRLRQIGFLMKRQPKAKAWMKNVTTLKDRFRQSIKYQSGKKALANYFSEKYLKNEYSLPRMIVLKHLFLTIKKYPFWVALYLLELLINRIYTLRTPRFKAIYDLYPSSKNLGNIKKNIVSI